jgi:hypothetical protein
MRHTAYSAAVSGGTGGTLGTLASTARNFSRLPRAAFRWIHFPSPPRPAVRLSALPGQALQGLSWRDSNFGTKLGWGANRDAESHCFGEMANIEGDNSVGLGRDGKLQYHFVVPIRGNEPYLKVYQGLLARFANMIEKQINFAQFQSQRRCLALEDFFVFA